MIASAGKWRPRAAAAQHSAAARYSNALSDRPQQAATSRRLPSAAPALLALPSTTAQQHQPHRCISISHTAASASLRQACAFSAAAAHAQFDTLCRCRTFRMAFARRRRPQASFCFQQVRRPSRAPTTAHLALAQAHRQLHPHITAAQLHHSPWQQHTHKLTRSAVSQQPQPLALRSGKNQVPSAARATRIQASSHAPATARAARTHWYRRASHARSSTRACSTHAPAALTRLAGTPSASKPSLQRKVAAHHALASRAATAAELPVSKTAHPRLCAGSRLTECRASLLLIDEQTRSRS